jgi:hypothetical protein
MPGSPNTSFIPKHTSNKAERKNTPRQLFIGTIIVRIFFFATLIASVGVFAFERKLSSDLAKEVDAFKAVTQAFTSEEEKVQTILSLDKRLIQANNRFNNSLSMVAILDTLDKTTLRTVELDGLEIEKKNDTEISMVAEVVTDTFDSVIFQRSVYEADETFLVTEFEDVTVNQEGSSDSPTTPGNLSINTGGTGDPTITFKATISINHELIPVVMDRPATVIVNQDSPVVLETSVASTSASTTTATPLETNSDNP